MYWKNKGAKHILNYYKKRYLYRNFKEIQNINSPYSLYNKKKNN